MRKEEITPAELTRKELSRILKYDEFCHSLILSKFLEFIIEKKLAGREDEIKEYTIGVKALGKRNDFNPQLDAYVRIHAGRLRQALDRYYLGPGAHDDIFITIPKGSYVPVIQFRSAVLNPAPDLRAGAENRSSNSNGHPNPGHKRPVLAVLPFHNLSPENSKDFFVLGIGEQLSIDLAKFQNISVISYYSTYKYDTALKDLHEMKQSIDIDYVLTGSVRFTDDLVRLNVQLILAENGEIFFTETYSRNLTTENIFDIQEEIVNEVLNVIADDHGIIMRNKANAFSLLTTEDLSIQEAVYKYFDFIADYDLQKFEPAMHALEKAVNSEPSNALTSALLAGLYTDMYITSPEQDNKTLQKAIELAQSAVRSDSQNQHAYKVLAWTLLLSHKKEKSLEAIDRCIKLNPKASSIVSSMALAYVCQGEYAQCFKYLLETVHLNPVVPGSAKFAFGIYYFYKKDFEESLKWIDRLSPLETPFLLLLRSSIWGNMHQLEYTKAPYNIIHLKDQATNIIGRMIFDPELQEMIIDGLMLAGLSQEKKPAG